MSNPSDSLFPNPHGEQTPMEFPAAPREPESRGVTDSGTSGGSGMRRSLLLRTMFDVLQESDRPLPAKDVVAEVVRRVPPTAHESEAGDRGRPRYDVFLRFSSTHASKIGWVSKRGGQWSLTDAGAEAVQDLPDDAELRQELNRRYRQAHRASKNTHHQAGVVADVLAMVDEGSWISTADLAQVSGVPEDDLARILTDGDLPNGHRVLADNGALHATGSAADTQRNRLVAEGVQFDAGGRALPTQRIDGDELYEALDSLGADESSRRRAWLVRGSSVDGHNLVPTWLEQGWISLAASNLRALDLPASRAQLAEFVAADYQHKSYAVRQNKTAEFDAFLNQMKPDDLVLTTSGGHIYGATITGPAVHTSSDDGHSNLRRPVNWLNHDGPIVFGELPEPLPAKLGSQADVVDLTEALSTIERMLLPEDEAAPPRELSLRDADGELADSLHLDQSWLQEVIDLLRDRRQLIFYGPPGTGKTYVAQQLAEHLTEAHAYKLVQFHPSYSYEDFFEGYRPVKTNDGTLAFDLHPGPLRRIVEVARDDPSTPYILIIDEINRANLAKVFGELYFLLEYRDRSIELLYSAEETDFTLPANVFFIGTMNTADRSIALVDAAMRRRFAFVHLHPAEPPVRGLLHRWLAAEGLSDEPARILDELNSRIGDPEFAIGPSYFMRPDVHREGGLERTWRTDILPLLEEHHYGDPVDVTDRYSLQRVRTRVTPTVDSNWHTTGQRAPADDPDGP